MIFTDKLSGMNFNVPIIYFIHIPKTAGSALQSPKIINLGHAFNIKDAYRTPSNKKGYHDYDSDKWPIYKYPIKKNLKITIIRNPFDLLCSYYFQGCNLKEDGSYCHSGWASVNYTHQFKSFKQFITSYCDKNFKWHQPLFKQFLFSQLFDENDNCVVQIIIKYEFLKKAHNLLNKYGLKINTEHKNNLSKNKKKNYKEYYDDEMIKMVNEKCERELEVFKYNFYGSTNNECFILKPHLKYNIKKDKLYFKDNI